MDHNERKTHWNSYSIVLQWTNKRYFDDY